MKKTFLGSGVFALAAFGVAALLTLPGSVAIGQQEQGKRAADKAVASTGTETVTETAPTAALPSEAPTAKKAESKKAVSNAAPAGPAKAFVATCYSLRGRMANGTPVHRGAIAADPRVLPLGTRVYVSAGNLSGEYVVKDTGGAIKGRRIDIWVPSTGQAMNFGRRTVQLTVLSGRRNSGAAASTAKNAQSAGSQTSAKRN